MRTGYHFYADTSHVVRGLANFADYTQDKLKQACKETAQEMEDYARENAPWRDRTGDARANLTGSWGLNQYVYYIRLAHGVPYGVYLEMYHEKRFEVIAPTLRKYENRVWEIYRDLMEG